MPSFKKDINQQLRDTIYKKVTKKTHNHGSPKKNGDGTIKKCIELFKEGASPEVLTKLEKSLREQLEKSPEKQEEHQKHYKYYIENFLPALKDEVIKSEELAVPTVFNNEREQSQRPQTIRGKIVQTILDITSRSSSVSSIPNAVEENIEEQNNTQETPLNVAEKKSGDNKILSNSDVTEEVSEKYRKVVEEIEEKQTSKLSSGNDSDSGINSPGLASSSRRSSVSSILSSAGENNDPQKEDTGNQMQPVQAAPEEPKMEENENSSGQADPNQVKEELSQVSLQQVTEARGEESKIPVSRTGMTDAITTMQKPPVNEKKGEDTPLKKQPNNRNLHVALVAGCALSTIGCIVAGAMTSGLVGAGLLAMAAVFAIAAVAELHSNFLSSKLTSISVEPHVNDKELTACSRL